MAKTHRNLSVLLLVQLLLAAALAWWSTREPASTAGHPLLAFDKDVADRVVIEGPDKARVELVRKGGKDGRWVVAQAGDFAADAAQVGQLLGRLGTVSAGDPVATSAEAAERFKVADADFERRVTVEAAGKPLATLLLGSAKGARQTYARKPGANDVYAVDLPTYDMPTKNDDWLDKAALQLPRGDIVAIEVDGLKLTRVLEPEPAASVASTGASAATPSAAPPWQAQGLGAGERFDAAAADRLAQALAELRFNALRGRDEAARKDLGDVELRIGVQRKDGQRIDYTLRKLPSGDDRALVLSTRPETFTLTSYQAKALTDAAARKALVAPPRAAASAAAR